MAMALQDITYLSMVRIYTRDWQLVCSGHTTEEAWLNLPAKYYGKKYELGLFAYYL